MMRFDFKQQLHYCLDHCQNYYQNLLCLCLVSYQIASRRHHYLHSSVQSFNLKIYSSRNAYIDFSCFIRFQHDFVKLIADFGSKSDYCYYESPGISCWPVSMHHCAQVQDFQLNFYAFIFKGKFTGQYPLIFIRSLNTRHFYNNADYL